MLKQIYNWKRFWCPRAGNINLSDGGYLYDPDSEFGSYYNPDVVSFESIAEFPCLVLLGEPGIGKSETMKSHWKSICNRPGTMERECLWIDLRAYQTDIRLCQAVFENQTFRAWLDGTHVLHLFLDSLDECLLRIDTVAALLIEELRKYPLERLYLRIACRTLDWPASLEDGLSQLWGSDSVKVYELVPLRRIDVAEAAKANGLDPETFLLKINHMEAVPLAIKPVTLEMLIKTSKTGQFPSTQAELYLQGCRLLCEETNQSRRDAKLRGDYTADQRMAVAARIAAVTIFANKYAIWTGIDQGDVPEEDVTIRELCGEIENIDGRHFEVSEAAILETLATALFSSRGSNRIGWSHQTYAEFLAAWYLVQRGVTPSQIMSLIVHPGDPGGRIVPQLHELAAWLAGMKPEVFREIMKADPEVLLRSDVATTDLKDRAALVDELLRLYDEEKLLDRNLDIRRGYKKLAHPSLAGQLYPYISDVNKGIVVRRVAIDIAEACELKELQEEFVHIVLDPSQPLPIRVNAAYAIYRIGDDKSKEKLKPLAVGEVGEDPEDELKGCGLLAVWPAFLTADELFAILTPPKRENFLGAYALFLSQELIQHLQPGDLPVALNWVAEQQPTDLLLSRFEDLEDKIMLRAWDFITRPDVLKAFAKAILSRMKNYYGVVRSHPALERFKNELSNNDGKRRRILEVIVPMLKNPQEDFIWLVGTETPVALSKDLPWMIDHLQESEPENQKAWAHLIERVFDSRESIHAEAVYYASQVNHILVEMFSWFLEPVQLNSPQAQRMKESYLEREKWLNHRQCRPLLKPPPGERIAALLDECEAGNSTAWWRLNMEMTLQPDSTHYGNELEADLTTLPGWVTADTMTRQRFIEAAKRYILEQDPATSEWLGKNILHRPAFAGYRALLLLMQEDPSFLVNLSPDNWRKWAPIIIAYPLPSNLKKESPHTALINMAYQYAAEEIIETLITLIEQENREHDHIFIIHKVHGCWDDRIANALLVKVKSRELKPKCMGCLFGDLLDHKVGEAREFAETLITLPIPMDEKERERAVIAACVLMEHTDDAGWPVVWPAILQNTEFGRQVVSNIAYDSDLHGVPIVQKLAEEQLADLYIWLAGQFPYSEDPIHEEAHWIGPRGSIAEWRDSILAYLKNRGTHEACVAIRRIAHQLPELEWLKWTVLEAEAATRRRTWIPLRSREVLKLTSNHELRLVQNGDQLLDVLIESLNRLENMLHSETPAVIFLWNEIPGNKYRPKDENSLSDSIKIYLDQDLRQRGIIFNREVEIRRGLGSGFGERTDIHVDAFVRGPHGEVFDSVTVIIEVKGCWNPHLNNAMKTQLVDRYLKDKRCRHGLYLVGWFNCAQWDDADYRKRHSPKINIGEARRQFEAQARELSQQGVRIKAFVLDTALR
ncbi:NACHT domain-containing protein [Moorella sp. Hama-1]|uniref:NACHT domain-containing protein n=1 Tax=Moorella sp. Hama-1 TaxID=2138101 RepID=UPI000D640ED4|nr:hypothetical protein [Moorella sp. Hama-1]BCV22765.1 hypothetical protein hamaS1_28340 [Moorella sp. Hama-1]